MSNAPAPALGDNRRQARGLPDQLALYVPKIVTVLREGYGIRDLRADLIAGLTVAIVALPLSMAIAIASGVPPDRGLFTAIVGGALVSGLGGSRFQVGGPAGAFIVLVAATVAHYGIEGLLLATFVSGALLLVAGVFRLGTFVKYIPYPVTVAFTTAIAVIIFASQIKELLGLSLARPEPGALIPKIQALWQALPTLNVAAVAVAAGTIGVILTIRRYRPHWPVFVIAVVGLSLAAWLFHLPVATIGTRFGGIPRTLPSPHLPPHALPLFVAILPTAFSFALLGSIESLLSAVVADSMTGRHHRSNCELVAQGIANMCSSLLGGFCVTGTIARTATNVRAGARGPLAGIFHSLFLLLFMLIAAPLASYVPLASLAAVLAVVTWTMADRHEFVALVRASRGDAAIVLTTFIIVAFYDLTQGILAGFVIGTLLFLHRMASSVEVVTGIPSVGVDQPDATDSAERPRYDAAAAADPDVLVCRISGAFFFGAAANVAAALDEIAERPKAFVLDISALSAFDSTAAATIERFVAKAERTQTKVTITGATAAVRSALERKGLAPPRVAFTLD